MSETITTASIWMSEGELRQLRAMGFKLGKGVRLARTVSLRGFDIEIGDGSQIDDLVVLDGHVRIGRYCHVSCRASVFGGNGFFMGDFSGLSPSTIVLTGTEDHNGGLTGGPALPPKYRAPVIAGPVQMHANTCVYANAVLLPNSVMLEGAILGANSMLKGTIPAYEVWGGTPARHIGERSIVAARLMDEAKKDTSL